MGGQFSQIHQIYSLFFCYKKLLVLTKQSYHGKESTHYMSSYDKNKQQMGSVKQHQFRRRQMWGKFSQNHIVHSLFIRYKKCLALSEQSIHGKVSTH